MNKREKLYAFLGAAVVVGILIFAMSYSVGVGLLTLLTMTSLFTWIPVSKPPKQPEVVPNEEIEKELETGAGDNGGK